MILIIKNQTNNSLSYLSGAVTLTANETKEVSSTYLFQISRDPKLIDDCKNIIVILNDGIQDQISQNALDYLDKIAISIGAAVVGKINSTVPNYSILVGGETSNALVETLKLTSTGELKSVLVGNDGLYTANVDSIGRLSTNSNITFPESIYIKCSLLNSTSKAMNINGSSVNVSFKYIPTTDVYYLEQLSIVLEDQGDFLPSNFGALATLTNGVQINIKSKGTIYNIANLKDNSDIYGLFTEAPASQSISVLLQSNRNSYWAGWRFQNRIALDPGLGDYVEFLVRDNLTGLNTLNSYISIWRVLG